MKNKISLLILALVLAAGMMVMVGCGSSEEESAQWTGTWDLTSVVSGDEEATAEELEEEAVLTLSDGGKGTFEDVAQESKEEVTWEETEDGINITFSDAEDEYIIMTATLEDGKIYLDLDSGEDGEHMAENFYVFTRR